MSDLITINTDGLEEAIRCAICENPIKSERGCDGSCQYDKELHEKIVEAVEGIAEQRPHGEWIIRKNRQGKHIYSVCSRCNVAHLDTDFPNFCENCGADMRKEEEGEAE